MPISYKLRPILDIFTNPLLNLLQTEEHSKNIALFKETLQKAYEEYCEDYLVVNNEIDKCKEEIQNQVNTQLLK